MKEGTYHKSLEHSLDISVIVFRETAFSISLREGAFSSSNVPISFSYILNIWWLTCTTIFTTSLEHTEKGNIVYHILCLYTEAKIY